MARVTVEDCLGQVNNRFALVHLATQRVRQFRQGVKPSLESKNKEVVVSLREIAASNVTFDHMPDIVHPVRMAPGALTGPDADSSEDED